MARPTLAVMHLHHFAVAAQADRRLALEACAIASEAAGLASPLPAQRIDGIVHETGVIRHYGKLRTKCRANLQCIQTTGQTR
jgi:hypothetical protein